MRWLLLFASCATILAQRTPFRVNGTVVNNPKLTNTSSITWSTSGDVISGTSSSLDTIWTNVATTTRNLSNNPVTIINNVPGHGVPLTLDNQDPAVGVATDLNLDTQGTNNVKLISAAAQGPGGIGTEWQFLIEQLDSSGVLSVQAQLYSRGDILLGFLNVLSPSTTNGFLHIPSASGLPTGNPWSFTSSLTPIVFNRADNRLWAYNTNWFDVSGQVLTYLSAPGVSIGQYDVLKFGADSSHVDKCGSGNVPIGVALTSTSGGGQSLLVMMLCGSVTFMNASGTVTFGSILEPAATGHCQTMGAGAGTHYGLGRSLETKTNAVMKVQTFFFRLDL